MRGWCTRRDGSPRWHALAVIGLVAALVLLVAGTSKAAPGEDDTPVANPNLPIACGIDIEVILDESGSVQPYTKDVQKAFRAFTGALKNTGSSMAVSEFSTVARLPLPAPATRAYTDVTDATIHDIFEPYIANNYRPNGSTHWEDAFRLGRYFLPRPSDVEPHLVVFITDGDPNKVVRESKVTYDPGNPSLSQNEYENKVPLADDETSDDGENDAKDRAVSNANAIKAMGSHILTVAVGAGLNSPSSLQRIIDVSGPDVFDGSGTFDIATDDVYRVANFDDLADAMREAAFQLCAPSITVRKLIDQTPDPGTNDAVPGENWDITAKASPIPSSWVLPPGASGASATTSTDASGFANFQWNTATPVTSQVDIDEAPQQGYQNVQSETACTFRTPDQDDTNLPVTKRDGGFSASVPDNAIVTCRLMNRIPPAPAVTIQKSTNGADADSPPGPFVPLGDPVNWTYLVTNTGNTTLTAVTVSDDQAGVAVSCPASSLAPGDFMTCTANGLAVNGLYTNVGTVHALDSLGTAVSATDPSHYTGATAGIDVEKATNGVDADLPPGPFVPVGSPVTWTYTVKNTGTAPISGVNLTDDQGVTPVFQGGDDDSDNLLDTGETWTYQASDPTAEPGQYENNATVTGSALGGSVSDSDASHYFGSAPAIDLEKFVNGSDADTAPGVLVAVGDPVDWTYEITNTGNVPVRWSLTDVPDPGSLVCPRILILLVGQTVTCHATLTGGATAGAYQDTATVTGTGPAGITISDSDPAHHFGVAGSIDIEKATNGEDADKAPGPAIAPGGPVAWTFVVTNTGNGPLSNVDVTDLRGVTVTCPGTTLAAGASMTCNGAGTALPDEYTNLATVTAKTALGDEVRDADPSHYFGATPGILLEKSTNGVDADDAPGVLIPVGQPVEWTYTVTNTGNDDLTGVSVTDDKGVAVTCPATTLAAGAEMTCTATGTAAAGDYANTGTATGTPSLGGGTVSDDDPSHYFGVVSKIDVEKSTNGIDADSAPGPSLPVGGAVTWTYRVTNPGNVYITNVALTDDKGVKPQFVSGDTNGDGKLQPGETWVYEGHGTASAGQYANVATVTGLDQLEDPVTDSDPSHYLSQAPPLPPSGGTEPENAASPPAPRLVLTKKAGSTRVRSGNRVNFKLKVRNTGKGTATRVRVCDRLPAGLVYSSTRGARVRGRLACFTVGKLKPKASRTYTVRARAESTARARRICNTGLRSARGVRARTTRACLNVLPAVARGGGVTG